MGLDDVAVCLLDALGEEPDDDYGERDDGKVGVSLYPHGPEDGPPVLALRAVFGLADLGAGVDVEMATSWATAMAKRLGRSVEDAVGDLASYLHRELTAAADDAGRWRVLGPLGLLRVAQTQDRSFPNPRTGELVRIGGRQHAIFIASQRARAALAGIEPPLPWPSAEAREALTRCIDPDAIERRVVDVPSDLRLQRLPHPVYDVLATVLAHKHAIGGEPFAVVDHGGDPDTPDQCVVWYEDRQAQVFGVPQLAGRPAVARAQWNAVASAVVALHRLARSRALSPDDATEALAVLRGLVPAEAAEPLAPLIACLPF